MNRKGIEKGLVVLLFALVLVVFSFAERDSKKVEHLYRTVLLPKMKNAKPADVVAGHPSKELLRN